MKTNRFAPTSFIGLACAAIAALGAAGSASAGGAAPVNAPAAAAPAPAAPETIATFALKPNPKFVRCMAQYPDDASKAPSITVQVVREGENDKFTLLARYIKPDLAFDLFTVENSPFNADGSPNPAFTNFGFAWYQSDLEASAYGVMASRLHTILLDQIFGFDPAVPVGPTSTFEVGFWFNDPKDAAPCGFDVTQATPFNGEHKAGPLAAISLPSAATGLGPLCTNPDTSVSPTRCNP